MAKKKAKKVTKKKAPAKKKIEGGLQIGTSPEQLFEPALKGVLQILENKSAVGDEALCEAFKTLRHFGSVSNIMITHCAFEGCGTAIDSASSSPSPITYTYT